MRRLLYAIIACAYVAFLGVRTVEAQQGRLIPGQTPCDLVSSGCAAAYGVTRRVVKGYTGHLFQLSRTGGGGGTQNIDALATGNADTATIGTFCGSGSTGPNAGPGANACAYHIIYDQSGNASDLTAAVGDTPYTTDGASRPYIHILSSGGGYFNNDTPSGSVPTGTVDKTVIAVFDDSVKTTTGAAMFGLSHLVGCSSCLSTLSIYGLTVGPLTTNTARNLSSALHMDLEVDSAMMAYGPYYANTHGGTYTGLGIVTFISGYDSTGHTITMQVNGGPTSLVSATLVSAPTIKLGAGGDATRTNGNFYEGYILAKNVTTGDRQVLNANTLNYYGVPRNASCGNAARQLTPVEILGPSGVTGLSGLRVLNASYRGQLIQIQRASDSHTMDIGSVGCDLDTATASTFCASTTCTVVTLYDQTSFAVSAPAGIGPWANNDDEATWDQRFDFQSQGFASGSTTTPPALTFSCVGSHPCMTFTGASSESLLQSAYSGSSLPNYATPLSLFAAASRTSGFTSFMYLLGGGANPNFFGWNNAANTGYCSSTFPGASPTVADSAIHGLTCVVTDPTHVAAYVESASTTASSTQGGTTVSLMSLSGPSFYLTGQVLEVVMANSALSSGTVTTLAAAAKAYWGY